MSISSQCHSYVCMGILGIVLCILIILTNSIEILQAMRYDAMQSKRNTFKHRDIHSINKWNNRFLVCVIVYLLEVYLLKSLFRHLFRNFSFSLSIHYPLDAWSNHHFFTESFEEKKKQIQTMPAITLLVNCCFSILYLCRSLEHCQFFDHRFSEIILSNYLFLALNSWLLTQNCQISNVSRWDWLLWLSAFFSLNLVLFYLMNS